MIDNLITALPVLAIIYGGLVLLVIAGVLAMPVIKYFEGKK